MDLSATGGDRMKNKGDAGSHEMSRRELLQLAGAAALAGSMGAAAGHARAGEEEKKESKFSVGEPKDYPEGVAREFTEQKVMVFRDEKGVYSLSTICTHKYSDMKYHEGVGFICVLHGAIFDKLGAVKKKPAFKPLPWYEVTLKDGTLMVNKDKAVEAGTRLKLAEEKK